MRGDVVVVIDRRRVVLKPIEHFAPQLVACDDLATTGEQQDQDVERAAAQLDAPALFSELTGPPVHFEQTKSVQNLLHVALSGHGRG